jgi:signal transduction histidine kinase
MSEIFDKERIQNLIEVIMKVAQGDYTVQCNISQKNDEMDALGMGINMMIDDLQNNVDLKKQNRKMQALNHELRIAKEKAQESDHLKSAFLSNMSHEIRSPMNAIIGFTKLLSRPQLSPEKQLEYISYIRNSGEQLLALINDIIDVSKIESNQLTISKELCSINQLLKQVIEIIRQNKKLITNPEITLRTSLNTGEDYILNTDPVRFKQIFINLLNNAINFTERGYIELGYSLTSKDNQEYIKLFVKDTGLGIPKNQQDVIFERFRQIHNDRFQEGTGLGLSITKGLVDLLGGKIMLESDINKGSTFYVYFPYKQIKNSESPHITKQKKQTSIDLTGYSIYIAEDRLESYILLEDILMPLGADIRQALNGKELLELIEEKEADLVLLDIHMPVLNGYDTIREIRKRHYNFPVIAQTAYAMSDEYKKILKSGCNDYVSKPIDPDELIELIKKHLNL